MISNTHRLTISIFAISLITNCSEVKSANPEVKKETNANISTNKKELKNTTSSEDKFKQKINTKTSKEENTLNNDELDQKINTNTFKEENTLNNDKSKQKLNSTISKENNILENTGKNDKSKQEISTNTSNEKQTLTKAESKNDGVNQKPSQEEKESKDNKVDQKPSKENKISKNNESTQKNFIDEKELKRIKEKYNEIKQKINSLISAEAKELKNKEKTPINTESNNNKIKEETSKEVKNSTEKVNSNKVKNNSSTNKEDSIKTESRSNKERQKTSKEGNDLKSNIAKDNKVKQKDFKEEIESKNNKVNGSKVKQEVSKTEKNYEKSEGNSEKNQKVEENVLSSKKNNKLTDEKVEEVIKKIIPIVEEGAKKTKIPGGYLVIVRGNKTYKIPFGNIALNNSQTVSNDTLFSLASVSKSITAYLVGALVDAGKLKWNDKIRKYDKDFFFHNEELSAELTVQDLISHCSGFKHFSADSLWMGGYPRIKIVDSFKYLKQKAGVFRKYYGYQNIVFGLIGSVLEKVTGERYEDLVKKYIFDKMDMKDSSAIDLKYESSRIEHIKYLISRFKYDINKNGFFNTLITLIKDPFTFKPKKISGHHSRYNGNIYPVEPNGYLHIFPATYGLAFSANDFAKFIQMILNEGTYNNKTIVTKETFNKITSKITEINKIRDTDAQFKIERFPRDNMGYGIGTFITKYGDNGKDTRKVFFHMGGSCGATSFYMVSPEDNIGVGCVVSLGGTSHTLFTEYVCNYFLDLCFDFKEIDWIQEELDRQKEVSEKKKSFENNIKQFLAPMRNINSYIGKYTSDIYGDIEVSINKNNKLVISNGIKSTELEHVNGDVFKFPSKNMLISYFDSDEHIAFKHNNYNNIDSFYISCFSEGDTVFKRKEENKNDANEK